MNSGMVFIHGFGCSADIWRWQTGYFSAHRQVLAVNLPGHGGRPWQGENLNAMVALVYEECRESGLLSADIVASSFGGLVAIKLCELYPDFPRRLVFAGALPKFTGVDDFPAGLNVKGIRRMAGQLQTDVGGVLDIFFRSILTIQERESAQYGLIKELRRAAPLPECEALLRFLDILEQEDMRTRLSALNVFSLFLFGDSDPICPLTVAEPLRKLCPMGRIEAFKNTGHFPFLTIPEVFNRRVERFLK
jgi:pimeloyl-ACP methyl ester esterase